MEPCDRRCAMCALQTMRRTTGRVYFRELSTRGCPNKNRKKQSDPNHASCELYNFIDRDNKSLSGFRIWAARLRKASELPKASGEIFWVNSED
jgi:hypothetical protein